MSTLQSSTTEAQEIPCALKHNYQLPSEILAMPEIRGSRMEQEARIIRDALESQTNGMFDREILGSLRSIGSDSPLAPWKTLILTLSALYETDWETLSRRLGKLPRENGPALLADVLEALAEVPGGKEKRSQFLASEKKLYNLVAEDRRFVKSVAIQLTDTLEAGEEYFQEFALLAIREIREMDEETGRRLALWCLEQYCREDFDFNEFLESLKKTFSPSLAMRFAALVLSREEPEEGIKCWLLSLLYRIREGEASPEEAAEYLWIVSALMENPASRESGPAVFRLKDEEEIRQVLLLVRKELSTAFGMALAPLGEDKRAAHYPAVWAAILAPRIPPVFRKTGSPAEPDPETARNAQATAAPEAPSRQPMQLELFGEPAPEPDRNGGESPAAGAPEGQPPSRKESAGDDGETSGQEGDGQPGEFPDFTRDHTVHRLLSPRPLSAPEEMKDLIRARPRYVGPEPWLEVIRQKRKPLLPPRN